MKKVVLTLVILLNLLLFGCNAGGSGTSNSGDADRGAQIFSQGEGNAPACLPCHATKKSLSNYGVGPNLAGIGRNASKRVEGLSADEYLRQSILEPNSFVLPGYRDMMFTDYREKLSDEDIEDLIAYLLTL